MLPSAIGAVVEGVPTTSQTPLSGHFSPVLAKVPIGFLVFVYVSINKIGSIPELGTPVDILPRAFNTPGKEVGYIDPTGYF